MAPVALGRPALLDGVRRLGAQVALCGRPFPGGNALGRLLVQGLGHRSRAAHRAQGPHDDAALQFALPKLDPDLENNVSKICFIVL